MLCLQRALQAFEKCADEENVHYAAGLNSLAAFLYAEGDCERALALYRKSMRYTLRFFGGERGVWHHLAEYGPRL